MTLGCFSAFPASDLILVIFLLLRLIQEGLSPRILRWPCTGSNSQTLISLGVRHREGLSHRYINGYSQRSKDRSGKPCFESFAMYNIRRALSSVR
jgi:hypothetical protein